MWGPKHFTKPISVRWGRLDIIRLRGAEFKRIQCQTVAGTARARRGTEFEWTAYQLLERREHPPPQEGYLRVQVAGVERHGTPREAEVAATFGTRLHAREARLGPAIGSCLLLGGRGVAKHHARELEGHGAQGEILVIAFAAAGAGAGQSTSNCFGPAEVKDITRTAPSQKQKNAVQP